MENANEDYIVIISDTATQMLVSHARFLVQKSEKAAQDLINEFKTAAKSLEKYPDRNSWLSDPVLTLKKYRKLLMYKRYMLIYQVKNDSVYIDYIVDCRQDYHWLI